MSAIPYKYFVYINLVLGLFLVIGSIVIDQSLSNAALGVSILGIVQILVSLFSKESQLPLPKTINPRLYTLIVFFLAIILNFLPYILKFTTDKNMLWLVLSASGISLISILFTNFKFLETK